MQHDRFAAVGCANVYAILTAPQRAQVEAVGRRSFVAGLTLFGMDFVNETVNGWILALTKRSALWTAPGVSTSSPGFSAAARPSSLRTARAICPFIGMLRGR